MTKNKKSKSEIPLGKLYWSEKDSAATKKVAEIIKTQSAEIVPGEANVIEFFHGLELRAWMCLQLLMDAYFLIDSTVNVDEIREAGNFINDRSIENSRFFYLKTLNNPIQVNESEDYTFLEEILSLLSKHPLDQQPEKERLGNIKKLLSPKRIWANRLRQIEEKGGEDFISFKIEVSYLQSILFLYAKVLPIILRSIKPVIIHRIDGAFMNIATSICHRTPGVIQNIYSIEVTNKRKYGTDIKVIKAIAEAMVEIISKVGKEKINILPKSPHTLFNERFNPIFYKKYERVKDWPIGTGKTFVERLRKDFKGVITEKWNGKRKELVVDYEKFLKKCEEIIKNG